MHMHLPHNHGQEIEKLAHTLPTGEQFCAVAEIFKLLGDPNRMKIFWILCHCEECLINISALMEMSSPAVSHHLTKLKAASLITSRREGKEVYYKATATAQADTLHNMLEEMVEISCPGK